MKKQYSKITFDIDKESTILTEQLSIKPLKIVNPKNQNNTCICMLTNYGGGFVIGDEVQLKIECKPKTNSLISSQANTRVYESSGEQCRQKIMLTLEEDSFHVFLNDPLVMHSGANFFQQNEITVSNNAVLLFIDWFSAGRSENGENFDFTLFETSTKVTKNGMPIIWDNFKITPKDMDVNSPGMFGEHTSFLNVFLIGNKDSEKIQILEKALFSIEENSTIKHNTSRVNDSAVVGRFSAPKTVDLKKIMTLISDTLAHKDLLKYNPLERKY